MEKKFSEYNSPISAKKVESATYQCELQKLQKHYGFRVTHTDRRNGTEKEPLHA